MKKNIIIAILTFLLLAGFTTVHQVISTYGTVSPTQGRVYIYSLNAESNLYCRLYNTQQDKLWDKNALDLGAADTVTWANSALDLKDHTSTRGGWQVSLPTPSTLEDGWYDLLIYTEATPDTPVSTDTLLLGRHVYIKGNNIQSLDDL